MFENLTERLSKSFRNLVGRGKLTDENMKETLREVKKALLEADVALEAVKKIINDLKVSARGLEVKKSLTPAQALVKLVNDELVQIMGEQCESLDLKAQAPVIVLMAGLQGSGKTTSTAKLSLWLKERQSKKAMLASCDIYRPAAIDQLERLAEEVEADFYRAPDDTQPVEIAKQAIQAAKKTDCDVVIIDTAGRLHIDDSMMAEIKQIHSAISPAETLFVVDGMTGQDAAKTAKVFNDALPLTGVVVTKMDGDARGGAVLSIRHLTQKPIKFIGMGEKTDALEPFHPDRMASRILGMGDVLSLVEELERKVDKKEAERLTKKMQKGRAFDLEDFRSQILQMKNMGGMTSLMDKLPGMGSIPTDMKSKVNDKAVDQMLAIINSMTKQERKKPMIIKGSRKRRIAIGSGVTIQDVNRVLKQHDQMQKMMKKLSKKGGMAKMMRNMKNLDKMMPPGGGFG